jgi:Lon protease-like protein
MAVEIPLFELGTVLFPHMPLGLHVFEERYRAMLRDCQERGVGFGVVAIREGVEVGGGAVAHSVGTLAQIRSVERLEDGRSNLLVTGATRFRVVRRITGRPYPAGEIEYLADIAGDGERMHRLAAEVLPLFKRYVATLQRLASRAASEQEMPDDPELLGYRVAASLLVDVARRQQLLEADSTEDRLRLCLETLRREEALLERMLAHTGAPPGRGGMSPN